MQLKTSRTKTLTQLPLEHTKHVTCLMEHIPFSLIFGRYSEYFYTGRGDSVELEDKMGYWTLTTKRCQQRQQGERWTRGILSTIEVGRMWTPCSARADYFFNRADDHLSTARLVPLNTSRHHVQPRAG